MTKPTDDMGIHDLRRRRMRKRALAHARPRTPSAKRPSPSASHRAGGVGAEIGIFVVIFSRCRFRWRATSRRALRQISPPSPPTVAGQPRRNGARASGQGGRRYFWADWCPICTAQQGTIDGVQADHLVLTVAMQSGGAAEVTGCRRARPGLDHRHRRRRPLHCRGLRPARRAGSSSSTRRARSAGVARLHHRLACARGCGGGSRAECCCLDNILMLSICPT